MSDVVLHSGLGLNALERRADILELRFLRGTCDGGTAALAGGNAVRQGVGVALVAAPESLVPCPRLGCGGRSVALDGWRTVSDTAPLLLLLSPLALPPFRRRARRTYACSALTSSVVQERCCGRANAFGASHVSRGRLGVTRCGT